MSLESLLLVTVVSGPQSKLWIRILEDSCILVTNILTAITKRKYKVAQGNQVN